MNGTSTTSFAYDLANDVLSELYTGGNLGGLTVTNQFDTDLRRTNMTLLSNSTTLCRAIYGYDNASKRPKGKVQRVSPRIMTVHVENQRMGTNGATTL